MGLLRRDGATLIGLGLLAVTSLLVRYGQLQASQLQLIPPVEGSAVDPVQAAAWSRVLGGARRVDLNAADVSELERLPGIGPALARRIAAHRTDHGPFASVEALAQVRGIGPQTVARLQDYLEVK